MSDLRSHLSPLFTMALALGCFSFGSALAGPTGDDDDSARVDADGDGFTVDEGDCDDEAANRYPGASDRCGNGVDEDCDGFDAIEDVDRDGDGQGPDGSQCACEDCGERFNEDCDDSDPEINNFDLDGDDWSPCSPGGGDCDETDPDVNPDGTEVCGDGIDNDCSGVVDDLDGDGDGFLNTDCGGDDCDDGRATTNPDATEAEATCNDEVDNDCDGAIDQDDVDCQVAPKVEAGPDQQDRYLGNWIVMAFDGSGSTDNNPQDTLTYTWTLSEGDGDFTGTTVELVTSPDQPIAYLRFHADATSAASQWQYDLNLVVGDGTFTTDPELPEANLIATIFRPTAFQDVGCTLLSPAVPGFLALLSVGFGVGLRRRRR